MADGSSVDVILDFLRRNKFTRAEEALRSEITNRSDLNGFLQNLTLEEKDTGKFPQGQNGEKPAVVNQGPNSRDGGEASEELIVKEIECGTTRSGPDSRSKGTVVEQSKHVEMSSNTSKGFTFPKGSERNSGDLQPWKFNSSNGPSDLYENDVCRSSHTMSDLKVSGASYSGKANVFTREDVKFAGEKDAWVVSSSKNHSEPFGEPREVGKQAKVGNAYSKDGSNDNPWSTNEELASISTDPWKDCSIKTVFPFTKGETSNNYDIIIPHDKKEGKKKAETINDVRVAIKDQVDEVGRALYFGKTQGAFDQKNISSLGFPFPYENPKEELPRLPPVKLKSEEKSISNNWEEKYDRDGMGAKLASIDSTFLIGSFLDVPVGQEINSSGGKRLGGGNWLSVSHGIAEDTSDLVSGFATIGDGLSESIDYPNEYWDSDEYDDDEDVGYMRQPIEDEAWFLAHEIDYPSDNEKGTGHGSVPDPQEGGQIKDEDDDQSFAEEDSYFSGERFLQSKNVEPVTASDDPMGLSAREVYSRVEENDLITQYDGQLMDEEELNFMRAEPVWKGFVAQTDELIMLGDEKVLNDRGRPQLDDICLDDDQHGSVRSIGVGINSDAADFGSEVRESLVGGSSEGDLEYIPDHDVGPASKHYKIEADKNYSNRLSREQRRKYKLDPNQYIIGNDKSIQTGVKGQIDGGFSFPPPLRDEQLLHASSSKSLWSENSNAVVNDVAEQRLNASMGADDMLATWKRKSSDSSTVKSSRDEDNANAVRSANSSPSSLSNYGYAERDCIKKEEDEKPAVREDDAVASLEDEEAAAVQEQVRQIKAQEEEFETFNLKIVHRKNRHSLDEIKLLKYVNKHDPGDKYHLLRLYDYFYYREHLLIVCELLKANLYEFHKFNRESGGEVYFTMPRLQSITIQCLEALRFLHGLGLIHCDLKPENILVKSYSRCEVKVIDLGSSCFETDHLCSYVQSRSYRAPEVILGLPYDKKIDVWSLGCILAELCTGNVLFQNDSPATLLARVIGIIGPLNQDMLAKGRDTYKYFTKNHMLYERNQDTNRLEYLIPKKTSLRHRLPMGDQGFIDFVSHLLEVNPKKRPTAADALKHPWLSYPYEPISS
ncbi:hypothetical protein ACJRO7_029973 [Eucalyptus globulus]|uniref:Protein kinase domain-containing protein n=1 Tax=Eucalyptus globulus TaxID=34317 RepID=A0ABD3JCJ3_EUCGL